MTDAYPWIQDAFKEATDEQLFAELRRRGWTFSPASSGRSIVTPPASDVKQEPPMPVDEIAGLYADQSERNAEPEEKWLDVRAWIELAVNRHPEDALARAFVGLFDLIQPPSVRERRASGGD
jgi:hypothetical protein